jgi:hypothetical protein
VIQVNQTILAAKRRRHDRKILFVVLFIVVIIVVLFQRTIYVREQQKAGSLIDHHAEIQSLFEEMVEHKRDVEGQRPYEMEGVLSQACILS